MNKNLNLQSWVDVREVAGLVKEFRDRGIPITTMSDIVRQVISGVCHSMQVQIPTSEEAVEYLISTGLNVGQLRDARRMKGIRDAIGQESFEQMRPQSGSHAIGGFGNISDDAHEVPDATNIKDMLDKVKSEKD